ncbi:hypothetical protein ABKV19_009921 [Rosa sericea]
MEGIAGPGATSVTNERVAYKLKSCFDLAKEEIAKAVRAEEWGSRSASATQSRLVSAPIALTNETTQILVEFLEVAIASIVFLKDE